MKMVDKEGENGDRILEVDLEGIAYLMQGLETLRDGPIGTLLSTPSFWEERRAPWWKFWDRKKTMMSADFVLKLVESDA